MDLLNPQKFKSISVFQNKLYFLAQALRIFYLTWKILPPNWSPVVGHSGEENASSSVNIEDQALSEICYFLEEATELIRVDGCKTTVVNDLRCLPFEIEEIAERLVSKAPDLAFKVKLIADLLHSLMETELNRSNSLYTLGALWNDEGKRS